MTTSLKLPNTTASNVEEIGRHLDDIADGDLDAPMTAAVQLFVDTYTDEYPDLFGDKGEGQILYVGGESDD